MFYSFSLFSECQHRSVQLRIAVMCCLLEHIFKILIFIFAIFINFLVTVNLVIHFYYIKVHGPQGDAEYYKLNTMEIHFFTIWHRFHFGNRKLLHIMDNAKLVRSPNGRNQVEGLRRLHFFL